MEKQNQSLNHMDALYQIVNAVPVAFDITLFDFLLQQLQFSDARESRLVLVCHQRPIKVYRECQEHEQDRYENYAAGPGGRLIDRGELNPTQYGYLGQKQEQTYERGESPGGLDVPVQAFMWRFLHQVNGVQAADCLDVG